MNLSVEKFASSSILLAMFVRKKNCKCYENDGIYATIDFKKLCILTRKVLFTIRNIYTTDLY